MLHILMTKQHSVQNAAACLVLGARCCDHIMPVLQQLHWLQIQKWVDFKIAATLVYHSLSGMALTYLFTDSQLSSEEGHCHHGRHLACKNFRFKAHSDAG